MTNTHPRRILRAALQAARSMGIPLRDLRGCTLRDAFTAAELDGGVVVYWGLWADAELDATIGA